MVKRLTCISHELRNEFVEELIFEGGPQTAQNGMTRTREQAAPDGNCRLTQFITKGRFGEIGIETEKRRKDAHELRNEVLESSERA